MNIIESQNVMPSLYRLVSVNTAKKGKTVRHMSKMGSIEELKHFVPAQGTVALGIYEATRIHVKSQFPNVAYTYRGFDITVFKDKPNEYLMVDIMAGGQNGCEFHGSRESIALVMDYIDAYRYKNPVEGDDPIDIPCGEPNELHAIIHTNDSGTHYLAWQKPAWDDSGYFWTNKETFMKVLRNSTKDHPFLFRTKGIACAWLRNNRIRSKCKIITIKIKPGTKLNDPELDNKYAYPGISADIGMY